jgi:phosphoserine phosphatase
MTHVATLISSLAALDDDAVEAARECLPGAAVQWLDRGVAADILFSPQGVGSGGTDDRANDRALADLIRERLQGQPLDIVVQPLVRRRKRLLLADMDSTMIGQECIDELADMVGQKAHVAAITERAMRGDIAFAPALIERVALLKGLPAHIIDTVIAERIVLTPGARTLVATMRANGAYTCLVSGGFTLFTTKIAGMIGFDEAHANTLVIGADGRLAGEIVPPILGREAKLATLIKLRQRFGLAKSDTLVAGDGANDLAMIAEAGLGVAYHAKPAVAAAAAARIDHGDLTALLYAQGYRSEDFVA